MWKFIDYQISFVILLLIVHKPSFTFTFVFTFKHVR